MWSLCVFLRNNFLNFTSIFISICLREYVVAFEIFIFIGGDPGESFNAVGRQSLDVFNLRQWASNMEEN